MRFVTKQNNHVSYNMWSYSEKCLRFSQSALILYGTNLNPNAIISLHFNPKCVDQQYALPLNEGTSR